MTIRPVTRIEGEVEVSVFLDEQGNVKDVRYHMIEFRGFEAFCRGRPVEDLPRIATRICGVCPWAHHMASSKAADTVFGREVPELAEKLRRIGLLAHIIDSHSIHFFVMGFPDVFLGLEKPRKSVLDVVKENPKLLKNFLEFRKAAQRIEEIIGGKAIHPVTSIPGGISKVPTEEEREEIQSCAEKLLALSRETLSMFEELASKKKEELFREPFRLKSYYMGLVDSEGHVDFYDGKVRIVDPEGKEFASFEPDQYLDHVAEHVEPWSYAKFPYLRALGWKNFSEDSVYRVGPLARFNVSKGYDTKLAQEAREKLLGEIGEFPVHFTQASHWVRLIECLHAAEKILSLLEGLREGPHLSLEGTPKGEGVGIVEAPRGTLIHHYKANAEFVAEEVNVITPTAMNNAAICSELGKVARHYIRGRAEPVALAALESLIRAYDPCTACATHVEGLGGLKLLVYDHRGKLVQRLGGSNV